MSFLTDAKPQVISFGDRELSDVTLIVGKHEFQVHKMVLASVSDVFKAVFYRFFKANEDRIELKDVSPATFYQLMQLLYDRAIYPREDIFPSFCSYLVDEGKTILREFWCSKSEMSQLLEVADRFNLNRIVVYELLDIQNTTNCKTPCCFRCISIFLLLSTRDEITIWIRGWNLARVARAIAGEKEKLIPMDDAKLIKFAEELERGEA